MERKNISWYGGDSRYNPDAVADCISITMTDGTEFYFEEEWSEEYPDEYEEQYRVYWALVTKAYSGLLEAGADPVAILGLPEEYGTAAEHFDNLEDVPEVLQPYVKEHFKTEE